MQKKTKKPAQVPDVTDVSAETWDRAVWECAIRKRKIHVLDVVRAAVCLQRHGEYRRNHRIKLGHYVTWSIAGGAIAALKRGPLEKTGVDTWVSPGVVTLTLRMVAAGLEGHGITVSDWTENNFAYQSSGRNGTLNLHNRDNGRYRFMIDSSIPHPDGVQMIFATCPTGGYPGNGANELTCMIAEFPQVIPWLVRWLVAYDKGEPLPVMPDGKPYIGGYRCTDPTMAHLGMEPWDPSRSVFSGKKRG